MQEQIDWVDEWVFGPQGLDYVERVLVPGHDGHKLFVSDFGMVYCMTCYSDGITVGSVNDDSDAVNPRCGHPTTARDYETGRCLMEGCPCR